MACDETRKCHLNDKINATVLKSIKNVKKEHGMIQIKPTDGVRKLKTLLAICIRKFVS